MNKINVGIIGFGVVGQGVVKWLKGKRSQFKDKFGVDISITKLCDRSHHKKNTQGLSKTVLTKKISDVIDNPDIDVVIELIGGLHPAKELVVKSLKQGKHVITANKALISNYGPELFGIAKKNNAKLYFESSVGAGIPVIKTITEGIVGNSFESIYGIINGTCNYILSEMSSKGCSFDEALKDAQARGYAESDPTLDINGMDSTHKLAILIALGFGKFLNVKEIYTEGITHISHDDIEYAESLGLSIKLLAIAKKTDKGIDARVHPTLISKDHPLASINGVLNAVFLETNPFGSLLLSGEGAGQMAAASGVVSDLINLITAQPQTLLCNDDKDNKKLKLQKIEEASTKYYLRFMALDKPGVLSKITGILGKNGIGINSVSQKIHNPASTVPVIMLTEKTKEKDLQKALALIHKMPVVRQKPVAIRMEKL